MPCKEAAAHAGCSDETLKGWLSDHRIRLARILSDKELLAYPVDQWRRFTPHEQLLWVYEFIERGFDLHDFPLIGTLKRQSITSSDPWFHAEWATLLINFGGKLKLKWRGDSESTHLR